LSCSRILAIGRAKHQRGQAVFVVKIGVGRAIRERVLNVKRFGDFFAADYYRIPIDSRVGPKPFSIGSGDFEALNFLGVLGC
jgi:hypothetical protein